MKSADDEIVAVAEYADEDEFIAANRKDDVILEKEGWVKIFRSFESGEAVYSQLRVSTQQRIFLEDRGIKYAYC